MHRILPAVIGWGTLYTLDRLKVFKSTQTGTYTPHIHTYGHNSLKPNIVELWKKPDGNANYFIVILFKIKYN